MTNASLSSFLKFADEEQVLQEWEVLSDRGGFRGAEILGIVILLVLVGVGFGIGEESGVAMTGLFVVVAPLIVWGGVTRPPSTGVVGLTNWRLIYYENAEGRGLKRTYHQVMTASLTDVVGIHSIYRKTFLGKKSLEIIVHTKYEDGVQIRIGKGGLLSRIPLIGSLFVAKRFGKDALDVPAVLYGAVQEYRGKQLVSSVGY